MSMVRDFPAKRTTTVAVIAAAVAVTAVIIFAVSGGSPGAEAAENAFADLVSVEPYSDSLKAEGIDALWSERDRRLAEWSAAANVESLSDDELVKVIDAITASMPNVMSDDGEGAFELHELAQRRALACEQLDLKHPYHGEFC
jgi:hypothetical protein